MTFKYYIDRFIQLSIILQPNKKYVPHIVILLVHACERTVRNLGDSWMLDDSNI
jgi:hypothetical protein